MSAQQIEQREKKNPNDIDKVPVKAEYLNRCKIVDRKFVAPRAEQYP
jgi:hypothetical protein